MTARTSALALALAGTVLTSAPAAAQETVDIGVIRNDDVVVVQKQLYPMEKRTEVAVFLGLMPFDPYLTTPHAGLVYNQHINENTAFSLVAGGGWGFKSNVYRQLESPAFGVAPYAYRYLGSVLAGIEWSPIYAKLNLNGARVVHFDAYFAARGGLTVESSVIPDGGLAFGPTVSPGLGLRFFLGQGSALKMEFRDDLMLQPRSLTESLEFKQNASLTLGLSFLSKAKGRTR